MKRLITGRAEIDDRETGVSKTYPCRRVKLDFDMVLSWEPLTYATVRAEPFASCIGTTVFDQLQTLIHLTV